MDTNISNRVLEKYPNYKNFFEPKDTVRKLSAVATETWFTKSNIQYCLLLSFLLSILYIVLTLPFTFSTVGQLLSKVGLGDINSSELKTSLPTKNVVFHGFVFFIVVYFGLLSQKLA